MWVCPTCRTELADGRFCPYDGAALVRATGDQLIPGITLERELGRGLTGTVWRARAASGEAVAVKILHREWAEHGEMRERFLRESRAAAQIDHPCVVAPLATGELEDGRPYLVMQLIDGPALEDVLALGALPPARAAAIGADLASALAACHRAGVIHRDVKPGNVRIDADGRARLLDFGVARQIDSDEARLTQGGLTVGTPHYMSPEQCSGDPQTGRSDVYALGCVLYRLLTGKVPFDGSAVAVMLAHATRNAPPVHDAAPAAPRDLCALVDRCLAKRAGDRPAASELADALARIAGRAIGAPIEDTRIRFERAGTVPAPILDDEPDDLETEVREPVRPRRGRRVAMLAALALAALLAVHFSGAYRRIVTTLGVHAGDADVHAAIVPPPPPPDGSRRFLVAADDGVALRLGAPAHLTESREIELTVEAWDSDGAPLDTSDLVVTFSNPHGTVIGFAAEPTRERGVYRVRTRFDTAGDWVARVYPPRGDVTVTFHLDVS